MPGLNWCHLINFWCHLINIWGHVLLTTLQKAYLSRSLTFSWCTDIAKLIALEFEKSSDKVYTIDKPRTSMDNTRNTELKDKRMFCEVRRRRHIEYNLWQQVARLVSTKTWGKLFKKKNKKTNFYFLGRTITYNHRVQNEGTFSPVTQPCVCHQGAGSLFPFYAHTL